MKILVVGGSGVIGSAIKDLCKKEDFEVITASPNSGDLKVDLSNSASIEKMYQEAGEIDAVVASSKSSMKFDHISKMSKEDYNLGLQGKLLGQVDLVLIGLKYLKEKGSFTLTSGVMNYDFVPNGSSAAMVNSALEGFVQSAALEMPKEMRINIVSPGVVREVIEKYGNMFKGHLGVPKKEVAMAYLKSIMGIHTGRVYKIWG